MEGSISPETFDPKVAEALRAGLSEKLKILAEGDLSSDQMNEIVNKIIEADAALSAAGVALKS